MKPCVGLPHSKNPSLLEATSVSAAFSDATEPEKKNPQTNLLQRYWI